MKKDKMRTLTFEIPEDTLLELKGALGIEATAQLGKAAFMEWVDWILADRRPMSISDLETARVLFLYNEILVKDVPSSNQLSSMLQLPLGRARYIIQCLNYRYPKLLRKRLLEVAILAHKNATRDGNGNIVIDVNPECKAMIDQVFSDLLDKGVVTSEVIGKNRLDKVRYEMGQGHYDALLNALEAELKPSLAGVS